MPDFIRVMGSPQRAANPPIEYIMRASDVILITYDVARDATTITLRDVGQIQVEQGPDELETLLTTPTVATAQE